MQRQLFLVLFLLMSITLTAANLPFGFVETLIADNLDPTKMALTPDGRIFIAQKDGRVFVVENDRLLPDPLLTIAVDNNNERGLSGIICHPNFATNGYFYLFYNVAGADKNRISRFRAIGNVAAPEEEEVLLETDWLLSTVHNGGAMVFGKDGKLYISTGDGGLHQAGQDMNSTLAKVLRINDDGTIPTDNPFYDELEGKYRAIWARGLRNPFTMAVERETGKIFLNDVGNGWYEEINQVERGMNYGWSITEGPLRSDQTAPPSYQEPFYGYNHVVGGCAIIGGTFYDAPVSNFPTEYQGRYYFGDYCENEIRMIDPLTGEYQGVFATDVKRPLAMLVTPTGDFYYLERGGERDGSQADNTSSTTARLFKVNYIGSGRPFVSIQPSTQLTPLGEAVTLGVKVSGDAPFTYQWQREGVDITSATDSIYTINAATLMDNNAAFRVIVSNELGSDTSQVVRLQITENQRPTAEIQLIENTSATYRAGDRLVFAATASDAEDGELDPALFTWRIDFYHDNHNHPALSSTGNTDRIEYLIPTTGETSANVFYRVYFSVTDSEGLRRTVTRDILPELVDITINTEPQGLLVNVDGTTATTPYTFTSVIGLRRAIQAVAVQFTDDDILFFDNWKDGVDEDIYTLLAPDQPLNLTAQFSANARSNGNGLLGQYFADYYYEDNLPLRPTAKRIDATIDFDWQNEPPLANIGNDSYGVRWSGRVEPYFNGEHTFHVFADDGVRLWVNNELIIDQWIPQPITETKGTITLERGQIYPVRLEYFELGGGAAVRLEWSGENIAPHLVPQGQLFADDNIDLQRLTAVATPYPNPVADVLQLKLYTLRNAIAQLTIYQANGQLVYSEKVSAQPVQVNREIDTRNWTKGIYFVHWQYGEEEEVFKVIKN